MGCGGVAVGRWRERVSNALMMLMMMLPYGSSTGESMVHLFTNGWASHEENAKM